MSIYVYKPVEEIKNRKVFNPNTISFEPKNTLDFLLNSFNSGIARFRNNIEVNADLQVLKEKKWSGMSRNEKTSWSTCRNLLDIKKGDWIVYVNFPGIGFCTAAKVNGSYYFEKNSLSEDFRHIIPIEKESIIRFKLDSKCILPVIRYSLRQLNNYWRIYEEKEFEKSIDNLKQNKVWKDDNVHKELAFLNEKIISQCMNISENYLGEELVKIVTSSLGQLTNVVEIVEKRNVKETDILVTLIVTIKSGLPILGLSKHELLIVHIRIKDSPDLEYPDAFDSIREDMEMYAANYGLVITTSEKTKFLEKVFDLCASENRHVSIIFIQDEVDIIKSIT